MCLAAKGILSPSAGVLLEFETPCEADAQMCQGSLRYRINVVPTSLQMASNESAGRDSVQQGGCQRAKKSKAKNAHTEGVEDGVCLLN